MPPGSPQAGGTAPTRAYGLNTKREYLCYDQALEAGWGLDGAEAVLTLRAMISNGDFEEYWRFHLAREHQRLYPGTKQGQYALGA